MEDNKRLRLSNQIFFPVYLCSKEIARMYNVVLKDYDLTYTQYIVMLYFWEVGDSDLKSISDTMLLDPSTLTPVVKKLEQKGFIRRNRSAADERKLLITLTETGKALKEKVAGIPERLINYFEITEEESAQLNTFAARIIQILKEKETNV